MSAPFPQAIVIATHNQTESRKNNSHGRAYGRDLGCGRGHGHSR